MKVLTFYKKPYQFNGSLAFLIPTLINLKTKLNPTHIYKITIEEIPQGTETQHLQRTKEHTYVTKEQ